MTGDATAAPDPRRALVGYLTGPTAVGKTEVALRVASERGWSILSVDSRQIYRRLEIGTAKPTAAERARVPHLLVDLLDPAQACSAGRYRDLALEALRKEAESGRRVLAVGGAGLYWEALIRGLHPLPRAHPELRARHDAILAAGGPMALHRLLADVDPEAAARLAPGDRQRVGRALEVFEATGTPYSRILAERSRDSAKELRVPTVTMMRTREDLYSRIEDRCRRMLADGLVAEVGRLLEEGVSPDAPGMRTVGYREFVPHFRDRARLEECIEAFVRASRRYAKRQETWIRHRLPERLEMEVGEFPAEDLACRLWGAMGEESGVD